MCAGPSWIGLGVDSVKQTWHLVPRLMGRYSMVERKTFQFIDSIRSEVSKSYPSSCRLSPVQPRPIGTEEWWSIGSEGIDGFWWREQKLPFQAAQKLTISIRDFEISFRVRSEIFRFEMLVLYTLFALQYSGLQSTVLTAWRVLLNIQKELKIGGNFQGGWWSFDR